MAVTPVSFRSLVLGAGNLTISYIGAEPFRLTFTQAQQFHRGEAVAGMAFTDPDLNGPGQSGYTWGVITIAYGHGTSWIAVQRGVESGIGVTMGGATAWHRTNPGTGRARGGGWAGMHGAVANAFHYLYVAPFNQAGAPDWYSYIDTIVPINGKHPYTKDRWSGQAWLGENLVPYKNPIKFVPDLANRVAALDLQPPVLQS